MGPKEAIGPLAVGLFWLVAWQAASWAIGQPLLFCGPLEALQALGAGMVTPAFWLSLGHSFCRIGLGFACAVLLAVPCGAAAGRFPWARRLLAPVVSVMKSAPVVCIIALLLVWWGPHAATSVVVALVVFPPCYFALIEAAAARDGALEETARFYGIPRLRRWGCIRWPQALPFLRAASKSAVGMAWKAGVAAELIGLPAASIGEQVYLAKLGLDTAAIIAWTAMVILMGWACEKIVLWALDGAGRLPRALLGRRVRRALDEASGAAPPAARGADGCEGGLSLEAVELVRSFDGHEVIRGLSLRLEPGSRTCIMAPSGTGKTTLLRLMRHPHEADAGSLFFGRTAGSHDGGKVPPVSIMLQEPCLVRGFTAAENLALTALSADELHRALMLGRELLEDGAALRKDADQLSGGMKRRVELVRALAHPSLALLLDEPFASLDDGAKRRCAQVIDRELHGRTLVLTSHDAQDAPLLDAQVLELPRA